MTYTIREAKEEDSIEIERLARISSPLRGSIAGTYEYLALCFKRYFLVAECSRIVGFIIGLPNIDVKGEFWVYQIATDPTHKRERIAENLLDEEAKRFNSDGCKKIKARILATNRPSIELFTKYGFKKVDVIRDWIEFEKICEE
jgi:ribosomal protein S18 acetylase RimI-like enzyme